MFYPHEDCEVVLIFLFFSGGGGVGASDSSWACRYGDVAGHVSLLSYYSQATQNSTIHKNQSRSSAHQIFYFLFARKFQRRVRYKKNMLSSLLWYRLSVTILISLCLSSL